MQLLPADYVFLGITAVVAITGLFRGLSGSLAFVLATAAAVVAATFGWPYSATLTSEPWLRGLGLLVAALVVFGVVRLVVRKLVNGLLAQPADAIFGFLLGVLLGALALAGWAKSGFHVECSNLAKMAAGVL